MHSLAMNPIRSYGPRLFSLVASASGSALKKDIDLKTVMMEGSREIAEMSSTDVRKEILTKLLSTTLGVGLSLIISYYGLKWLANTIDPTKQEKVQAQKRASKLLQQIGVPGDVKLTEYELCIAANLVDPLSMVVSWEDIGGLENVIQDIKDTVILPFHKKGLFRESNLIQPPKGVLLYGPPGCGKTMIAKAMAKAAGARFINLQVSSLVDKWYGESQKRAEAVFSLALKLQPTIIFIDEIDSFLRARGSNDHEATAMVKTQFMSFWDGLMTDKSCRIVIIGASNRPGDIDAAILRRMPTMFNIDLPNQEDRKRILEVILFDEPVADNVDLNWLALQTEGFTGSDLREMCRNAAIANVSKYLRNTTDDCLDEDSSSHVVAWEIMKADFEKALNKMKLTKRVSNLATLQQMSID